MKRVLFIDRDATLIVEPEPDQQVDSLEKLEFIPTVFSGLTRIAKLLPYELVMVTNQDGLGTSSFPEETFWPAHNRMLSTFSGEGIKFSEVLIDRSFAEQGLETRKPGIGLARHYTTGDYDLKRSFVIGDRLTDLEFARNLGTKAIHFCQENTDQSITDYGSLVLLQTNNWEKIFSFLKGFERQAQIRRTTSETDVDLSIALDGEGLSEITTGIGFFDHMLTQIARHSGCNLSLRVSGDLTVDEHHTIEDTALALGEAVEQALSDKKGIARYGFLLPMDESLAQVALDFSGRPELVWHTQFNREQIGEMPTEMFKHFFKAFSDTAKCTLHISATGDNEHHKIEAIFKAFAKCLGEAWRIDANSSSLPSTKGLL